MSFKSGFVSIVGRTNVGKSSILNEILDQKVTIVSNKVNTTRNMIRGIYNDEDSQIVFIDTPGFNKAQNKLQVFMNNQIEFSLMSVDLAMYVFDAEYTLGNKERENFKKLKEFEHIKKIAVINKIDLVEQSKVLRLIEDINKENLFDEVIAISAKDGINNESFIKILKNYIHENEALFENDVFSDYSDEFLIQETIREKILHLTREEVPHSIGVKVKDMEYLDDLLRIVVDIYVERDSQKGIIIGKKGSMIKEIGQKSRIELKRLLNEPIYLDLSVKVLKNWENKDNYLDELGYLE